jgi:hypothetical protein
VSLATGVGHNLASALNFGSPRLFHLPAARSIASSATGVCHNPDALSQMGSAGIGRRKHSPFNIEPHLGQVSKNSSESPRSEHWAVFHFNSLWSNFANDPRHFCPKSASLSIESVTCSSGTDVLAGKSASHNVSNSSPSASVKCSNVIPNRERWKGAVVLTGDEDRLGVGINFDGAYASTTMKLACKDASTSAREKMKLIHLPLTICTSPITTRTSNPDRLLTSSMTAVSRRCVFSVVGLFAKQYSLSADSAARVKGSRITMHCVLQSTHLRQRFFDS